MSVVTIVTGLPRSGTSLMMQILEKSSLGIFSDGIRQKDNNNPEGYYELEAVKGIVKDFVCKATPRVGVMTGNIGVGLTESQVENLVNS